MKRCLAIPRPAPRGSALVFTLLVIVVLTVVITAFMQSMRIERLTSRSQANIARAELIAQAGFADALNRLVTTDTTHLISAYQLVNVGYAGGTYQVPYLTVVQPNATFSGTLSTVYLASTGSTVGSGTVAPVASSTADTVDINAPTSGHPNGWIGLSQSDTGFQRRVLPVQWIYVTNESGTIGRYAYWIDDESARVDVQASGTIATSGSRSRWDGASVAEFALNAKSGGSAVLLTSTQAVRSYLDARSPKFDAGWFGFEPVAQLAPSGSWAPSYEECRPFVGWGGLCDERGALGARKINLNDWVATGTDFRTAGGRDAIAEKVRAMGEYIDQVAPNFGLRYYGSPTPSAADKLQYCVKIAANIHDYIDTDSQPVVIRASGTKAELPPDPTDTVVIPGSAPYAFGKEIVPAIGEYCAYYYNEAGALRIDHTFEVWNLHSRAIDLRASGTTRILMARRKQIDQNGPPLTTLLYPGSVGRPALVFTLPSGTLPAGAYSLLTTFPTPNPVERYLVGSPTRVVIGPREGTYPYGSGLTVRGDDSSQSQTTTMQIVVANDYGYLDIEPRVAHQGAGSGGTINVTASGSSAVSSQSFGNDGATSGSNQARKYPLDSGDPRSFTECDRYDEANGGSSVLAWRRQTPNIGGSGAFTKLGTESNNGSSGILPANNSTAATFVPEPIRAPDMNSQADAISVIRDGPMRTIGELGYIYDPAINGAGYQTTPVTTRKRGGFRTLSIGSTMGEGTNGPAALSHVTVNDQSKRAALLLELFTASNQRKGLLLNSALRDPRNFAWKSLIGELRSQNNAVPDAVYPAVQDPATSYRNAQVNADKLVAAVVAKAKTSTPFLLLGQLADLAIFNSGGDLFQNGYSMTPDAANLNLLNSAREEVFRNLVGLLTLKGSRFRIYTIAQAGRVDRSGRFVPASTTRVTRLYDMQRDYPASNPLESTSMPAMVTNNKAILTRTQLVAEAVQ